MSTLIFDPKLMPLKANPLDRDKEYGTLFPEEVKRHVKGRKRDTGKGVKRQVEASHHFFLLPACQCGGSLPWVLAAQLKGGLS